MGYTRRGDIHKERTDGEETQGVGIYTEKKYSQRGDTHGERTYEEGTYMEREYISKRQIWRGDILQSGNILISRNINKRRHNW